MTQERQMDKDEIIKILLPIILTFAAYRVYISCLKKETSEGCTILFKQNKQKQKGTILRKIWKC